MSTARKPLGRRIARLLSEPAIGLRKLWLIHVRKDPRVLAYRGWKKANRTKDLRLDYALPKGAVVLDLGGYLGDFAADVRARFDAQVHLFEPSAAFQRACVDRFHDDPKVQCHAFGLGADTATLTLTDDADASSVVSEKTGQMSGETVSIRRFSEVYEELGLTHIDLLKINIEGGEFDVLPHLINSGLIARIDHLQIQFHDFVTDAEARRDAIRAALSATHECTWDYPFVWESWSRKAR